MSTSPIAGPTCPIRDRFDIAPLPAGAASPPTQPGCCRCVLPIAPRRSCPHDPSDTPCVSPIPNRCRPNTESRSARHTPPFSKTPTRRAEHQPLYWRSDAGRKLPTGPSSRTTTPGRASPPGARLAQGVVGTPDGRSSPYCLSQLVGGFKGTGSLTQPVKPGVAHPERVTLRCRPCSVEESATGSLRGIRGILTRMKQGEPLELIRPAWSQSAFRRTMVFR